jgi:hypothetical protein
MKALIRQISKSRRAKKWFRITAVIVLVAGALLACGYHTANRRGAEELRQAMAEARAAGLPLTRAELSADMPPAERNSARHGILKEWDDAMARPMDPGSNELLAPLRAFAKPEWGQVWQKPVKPRPLPYRERIKAKNNPTAVVSPPPAPLPESVDFSQMKKSDRYGQDPASFLAEFERRHGAVLRRLQHDLTALPELRRPLPEDTPLASDLRYDRLVRRCRNIQVSLALRAEAALQTGQPGLAAESIALSLKLGEALGSRGPDGTHAMNTSLREVTRPLKSGIARHQWRAEDLERIAAALKPLDLRRSVQRDVEATLLMIPLWESWKKDRHAFRNQGSMALEFSDARPIEDMLIRDGVGYLLPAGWFDWNAAELLRTTRQCHALALEPGPVLPWLKEANRLHEEHYSSGDEKKRRLLIAFPYATDPLSSGCRAMVQRDLMLAACAVERSYVEHRTYPAALPPGVPQDPLLGQPFGYRLSPDEGFAVYSLGVNGKDEGGKRRAYGNNSDDWRW